MNINLSMQSFGFQAQKENTERLIKSLSVCVCVNLISFIFFFTFLPDFSTCVAEQIESCLCLFESFCPLARIKSESL